MEYIFAKKNSNWQTVLLLFLLNIQVFAQDSSRIYELSMVDELLESKTITIEDVLQADVVTATRLGVQKNTQAPATIYIITAQQIQQRQYQSLLEVLADLPDVKSDFRVDPRWFNDVSLRGIRGMDKFIILLDGVRISSPTNDIIPIIENYPVNMAKQVEVVFGPASALYGADAFAGVINIITQENEGVEVTDLNFSVGQYNNFLGNIWLSSNLGKKINFSVGGQYFYDQQPDLHKFYPNDFQGLEQTVKTGNFNTIFGPLRSSFPVSQEISLTPVTAYAVYAKLNVGDFRFSFFRNYSRNSSLIATTPNNGVYNKGHFFGHSVSMASAIYEKKWEKLTSSTFLVGSRYDLDPQSNFRNVYTALNPAYLYSYGWMLKIEQLLHWQPQEKLGLDFGATYENFFSIPRGHDLHFPVYGDNPENIGIIVNSPTLLRPEGIPADFPKVSYNNIGFLAQGQYAVSPALALVAGVRYDQNSRFGATFNPRMGVVWQVNPKTTLKSLYGSAFLAPSPQAAYDQFGTFFSLDNGASYQSAFFRLPNPALKPQIIQTFEISLNTFINKLISISINGYYSQIDGLFTFVNDAGNTNLYNNTYKGFPVGFIEVTINQGSQSNFGGSFKIDFFKEFSPRHRLNIYTTLSWVNGTVNSLENGQNQENELPAITPLMWRLGVDWSWRKWFFSPRLTLVGEQHVFAPRLDNPQKRQTISGYPLLNATLRYASSSQTNIFLKAENLLDIRYHNVNLGAAPDGNISGAAQAEIASGSPQYPLRISAGVNIRLR